MKRFLLISLSTLVLIFTILALTAPELPPIPAITEQLSETVDYTFEIQGSTGIEVELTHTDKNNPMSMVLKVSGSWETRRPSLYLTSIHGKPMMKGNNGGGSDNGKGLGRFKKDNKGQAVSTYSFRNTLVKDSQGKRFVKMVYNGPDMPMIGTLILEKKLIFPGFVAKNFGLQGALALKPGTYTLDESVNGFFIEVAD